MKIEEIKDRIQYLKSELAHERYHDGWVIAGFKKELLKLNRKMKEIPEEDE